MIKQKEARAGGNASSLSTPSAHIFVFLSVFSRHFVKMTATQADLWAVRFLHRLKTQEICIDFLKKRGRGGCIGKKSNVLPFLRFSCLNAFLLTVITSTRIIEICLRTLSLRMYMLTIFSDFIPLGFC